jgi:putative ABC transport system substrate-binding protein
VRSADDIERVITTLSRDLEAGRVVMPSPVTTIHREPIVALAERYRVASIYPYRYFPALGGLLSFGVDNLDLYRRAASYVDRILKGEKPADLPVRQPTKFHFVVNLKTAKAIGVELPTSILLRADDVIE